MSALYDPNGRACGVDTEVKDYPYLYFTNPTSLLTLDDAVCVKKCPDLGTDSVKLNYNLECKTNTKITTCTQNVYNARAKQDIVCFPVDASKAKVVQ